MSTDVGSLIDGYLDDMLSPEQHQELSAWINASSENARTFAAAAMLHDRLRNESIFSAERKSVNPASAPVNSRRADARSLASGTISPSHHRQRTVRSFVALLSTVSLIGIAAVLFWQSFADNPAPAAVSELQRLIATNADTMDRTYRISVEETFVPSRDRGRRTPEVDRPPKAPLDGAMLFVRDGQQFVLERSTENGLFVTGSNGKVSWAVRPDGPVRFSTDLNQFNRDLPGHEHAMPLVNIHDGLERLHLAYDVQLLPQEDSGSAESATRLLVAVRHRKERGPKRVEISYEVESGLIRQMRFVEMPYGPELLTLRLTLLSEEPLVERFFDHESHHDADRRVQEE